MVAGSLVIGVIATSGPPVAAAKAPAAVQAASDVNYRVDGYSSVQAAAAVQSCLSSTPSGSAAKGATLRAAATDGSGSTLILSDATGWGMCNVSPGGAYRSAGFQTYASAEGWGTMTPPAGDLPASWLTGPVEIDSYGGGRVSKTSSQWVDVAVGRATANVTKVAIQMPGGSTVTANVQNGYFVARQVLGSQPALRRATGPTVIPVIGYSNSGAQVYNSLNSHAAVAAGGVPPCFATPSGQAVTPVAAPGEACQTATPW